MLRYTIPFLLLAGCSDIPSLAPGGSGPASPSDQAAPSGQAAPEVVPASDTSATVATPVTPPSSVTASAGSLDRVSETEKAEARAEAEAAPAGGELGTVTVALGDPADAGLWVKSDLVGSETPGTVRTAGGDAIAVTLRPLGSDGGAQISLSALQALGLPLTGLHPVTLAAK